MPPQPESYRFPTTNLKRYRFPTHINDLVLDRSQAQCSEVFLVLVPVDQGAPPHRHPDTEQIFYMIEGRGTLWIDRARACAAEPGDVIRIPAGKLHSLRADQGVPLKYLCVDCFGATRPEEATWDDHARAVCRQNGWDYREVIRPPANTPSP
jgi:mannose-6-phosphate isomerase-like protein (cupin superfamily)